jgi:hypothetical protein
VQACPHLGGDARSWADGAQPEAGVGGVDAGAELEPVGNALAQGELGGVQVAFGAGELGLASSRVSAGRLPLLIEA